MSSTVAIIAAATVVPGHDGRAELAVEIAYPGGGRSTMSLDAEATAAVAGHTIGDVDDLVGKPWHVLVGGAAGVARLIEGDAHVGHRHP